jgi:hypothetical protein
LQWFLSLHPSFELPAAKSPKLETAHHASNQSQHSAFDCK